MTARILGVDYGSRRIGIALSDPLLTIATPLTVVENSPAAFGEIRRLADEYDVERIVVGMPFTLKGEKGRAAVDVDLFVRRLQEETGRQVVLQDERFTSSTARETMIAMGVPKMRRREKSRIDASAAALILQGYLDSLPRRP